MSDEEDGGVILIASESNDLEETQTYYILDPCPSDKPTKESKIQLIDLTAEVKNTGAIAVLSTNTDTGTIEIRLEKKREEENKIKEEHKEMDSSKGNTSQVTSEEMLVTDKMIIDDDIVSDPVKSEEEEVDIEEMSITDSQLYSEGQEMKSEADSISYPEFSSGTFDSVNLELVEAQEQQNNLEDLVEEAEEDILYIDDVSNIKENQHQDNQIPFGYNMSEKVGKNMKDVDDTLDQMKNMIEAAEFVINETNSMEKMLKESNRQEGHNHDHLIEVPTESMPDGSQVVQTPDIEFVDSTNTALTLLELAGGNYRNTAEKSELGQEVMLPSSDEQHATEYTTLTTLQPIQLEACNGAASAQNVPETGPKQIPTKTGSSTFDTSKLTPNMQRLLEGDPSTFTKRMSYRRSSPLVSQQEIVEEVLERTKSKIPYSNPKDFIFTNKLAHRLANKIVPADKEKSDSGSESASSTPPSRKGSISHSTDDSMIPCHTKHSALSDKDELLKILEDDPDDPVNFQDVTQPNMIDKMINQRTRMQKKSKRSPLIKLHPELEKELALKQLENFHTSDKRLGKRALISGVSNFTPKQEKKEHNNNTSAKRQGLATLNRIKKMKKDNDAAVTVDPSEVTERLAVEGQELTEEQTKDTKSIKQYSNKRLSRNSETPPKEIPMEILLNGIEDEVENLQDGKAKNKIFKATNPRKRQEELKKKKQKHFANVLQRVPPHKKRGRPPKRKVPVNEMLMDDLVVMPVKKDRLKNGVGKSNADPPDTPGLKENHLPKMKKLTEIEKLLGDEGAINMLYSVEQKRSGGEQKQGVLPSYRRKKKDLILKTKLVKSAVLRLTASMPTTPGKVSLRGQAAKEGEHEETPEAAALRKMSIDSRDSHQSHSSVTESFPLPEKVVPAEASRIIRRHSSSSNYSSRSNSPRRLSVDMSEQPDFLTPQTREVSQGDATPSSSTPGSRSIRHKHTKTPHTNEDTTKKPAPEKQKVKELKQTPTTSKIITVNKTKPKEQPKKTTPSGKPRGRPKKISALERGLTEDEIKMRNQLHSSLAAAIDDFSEEHENINGNIPKKVVSESNYTPKKSVYGKTQSQDTSRRVKPVKQSIVYKELTLKRHDYLVEIILAPVSTKLKNSLNPAVLREVISVLTGLTKDDNCRVVLVTSVGDVFCQGVDFFSLVHEASEKRMGAALDMAVAIKDFIKALAIFTKPIVAGVQGAAVGLGVTMLPLFDLVIASDKATFHTPYAKLGQIPEGAATLTMPALLGISVTSELLFTCRKLTATEALNFGLVTRVVWGENLHDELLPIVTAMASQSSQSMDATKALLRHNLLSSLETTLVSETHLLIQHWTGTECQSNFALYLSDEEKSKSLALQTQPQPETT